MNKWEERPSMGKDKYFSKMETENITIELSPSRYAKGFWDITIFEFDEEIGYASMKDDSPLMSSVFSNAEKYVTLFIETEIYKWERRKRTWLKGQEEDNGLETHIS